MKPVACMLFGSQNYMLDGPDSDFDYKLLMMPDFNDFYTYHKVDKNDLPKEYDPEHYNVMSVLKFDENLRKGNVNALELLFSRDSIVYDANLKLYLNTARKAYAEGYVFSVWDSFLATVEGMMKNSLERYGVNRKSASRALYLLKFCYFVSDHAFEVDADVWNEYEVFTEARDLRFNESKELPTKEKLFEMFDKMKSVTKDNCNYHRLMNSSSELESVAKWNDVLASLMKNTVKEFLKKEL